MSVYRKTSSGSTPWSKWSKDGYVQKPPPYVNPLPYTGTASQHQGTDSVYPVNPTWQTNYAEAIVQAYDEPYASAQALAYARAYDNLISQIRGGTTASVGATIAERRESFDMIFNRANQILSSYRHIRKGEVRGALKVWGFKLRTQKKKQVWVRLGKKGRQYTLPQSRALLSEAQFKKGIKSPSSLWLEYWFGWAPLVSDVYAAAEILSTQIKPTTHRNVFRGHGTGTVNRKSQTVKGQNSWTQSRTATFGCQCMAKVTESNPNLATFNRLGIVNPALIAWELVPFSWFVDWWLPVGRYLESYTDQVGFRLSDAVVSQLAKGEFTENSVTVNPDMWRGYRVVTASGTAHRMTRTITAITRPSLTSRKASGISSLSRAATSVAILAGFLKRS